MVTFGKKLLVIDFGDVNSIMKKITSIALLILFSGTFYGQKLNNQEDFEKFYEESLLPIINRDTLALEDVIEFPVSGIWAMHFGFGEPDDNWNKADFNEKINLFITDRIIAELKKVRFENIEYNELLGFTEIVISIDTSNFDKEREMVNESSLIFFFKNILGKWKLHSVGIVG